jgi:peptide/nickel transport system substrate-binding protein
LLAAAPPALAQTAQVAQTTGQYGGDLRVAVAGGSLKDSFIPVGTASGNWIDIARMRNVYEPLANLDHDNSLYMELAESVEPNNDLTVWHIKLRQGITFHNGKPLTSDDVIATFKKRLELFPSRDPWNNFDPNGFNRIDPLTLELGLKQPDATLLSDWLSDYSNTVVPAEWAENPTSDYPAGTGPFMVRSFTPGVTSVFDRNPNYWRSGQPFVNTLTFPDFADDAARVNALLGGQVDAVAEVPNSLRPLVEGDPNQRIFTSNTGALLGFEVNINTPPFDDNRVRTAFKLLLNRQQFVDQVLGGNGRIANDLYSPFDPLYASDIPQRPFDLDQAKSLLAQAGYAGDAIQLTVAPVAAGAIEMTQVLIEQAKAAGVNVVLNQTDPGTYYAKFRDWQMKFSWWSTYPWYRLTGNWSVPTATYNGSNFNDEEFNSLVANARKEPVFDTRKSMIRQAQQVLWDRGGQLIPVFLDRVDGYNSKLTGFQPDTFHPLSSFRFREVSFQ